MSDHTCALSIAGLEVRLVTADAALSAALRERYRAYLITTPDPACLTLRLNVIQTRAAAPTDRPFEFRQGVLEFTAASYEGDIDLDRANGQLSFASPTPIVDADYFVRTAYALLALHSGGLLLHAAGVVRGARAFAFFGQSGSGKTTIARLSLPALVLNDDLVILRPQARQWHVHATPFSHPTQVQPSAPYAAPLALLLRLVQNQRTFLNPASPAHTTAGIIASTPVVSRDPGRSSLLFDRVQSLQEAVRVFELHFRPDASFWPMIESHLSRQPD